MERPVDVNLHIDSDFPDSMPRIAVSRDIAGPCVKSAVPRPSNAAKAFTSAMDNWDVEAADAAVAGSLRVDLAGATTPAVFEFDRNGDWSTNNLRIDIGDLTSMFTTVDADTVAASVESDEDTVATEADLTARYFAARRDGLAPGVPGRLVTAERRP